MRALLNVAAGWEKGRGGKNEQDSRKRIWLDGCAKAPVQSYPSLTPGWASAATTCGANCATPNRRNSPCLRCRERIEMMPMLPAFDSYVETSARVSSTCLVAVARNRYSMPCELAGQKGGTRLYPDRVGIVSADAIVAAASREHRPGLALDQPPDDAGRVPMHRNLAGFDSASTERASKPATEYTFP